MAKLPTVIEARPRTLWTSKGHL